MIQLIAKEYKLRLITLREWKRGDKSSDQLKFVEEINKKMQGNPSMSLEKLNKYYDRFDQGNTDVFAKDSDFYASPTDSLLFISDERRSHEDIFINNGRLCILPLPELRGTRKPSTLVYDLFRGTKRLTPISFDPSNYKILFVSREYLVTLPKKIAYSAYKESGKNQLRILKIDYDTLEISELTSENLKITDEKEYLKITVDQLCNGRFLVSRDDKKKPVICQIQHDKLTTKRLPPSLHFGNLDGKKLEGNMAKGFTNFHDKNRIEFHELNLNTAVKNNVNAPMENIEDVLGVFEMSEFAYSWSGDNFYAFFPFKNQPCQNLLSFDSKTLKWSNVGILARRPETLFVDENEVLTFGGGSHTTCCAFYRKALRSPDTLLNLTILTAAKELNLYQNDVYIKETRKLKILNSYQNPENVEIKKASKSRKRQNPENDKIQKIDIF